MYAIIEDSGQQFKVSEGDVIEVDLRELSEGATTLEFDKVLLVSDGKKLKVGTPVLAGAKVVAGIEDELHAGPKVQSFKYKRRKGYRKRIGHRQKYIQVKVTQIVG